MKNWTYDASKLDEHSVIKSQTKYPGLHIIRDVPASPDNLKLFPAFYSESFRIPFSSTAVLNFPVMRLYPHSGPGYQVYYTYVEYSNDGGASWKTAKYVQYAGYSGLTVTVLGYEVTETSPCYFSYDYSAQYLYRIRIESGLSVNRSVGAETYLWAYDYVTLDGINLSPEVVGDTKYNVSTRPTSITGGNYGIVGDDGTINTVTNNNQIINETNNTYYNPATGETSTIKDWSYNYEDRSYTVTLESGDTATVTYGDENISITENNVVEGSTTVNNYTIYYMVEGSGDPAPSDSQSPSPSVCPHTWTETGRTDPTCISPGSASYSCSQCGEAKTETLKAKGHTWQVERTVQTAYDEAGNLVQQGYTIYQCSVCGEQYKDEQGTGPPGGSADDDGESIWDKIGNFIGSIFDGIGGLLEAVLGKLLDALTALADMLMDKLKKVVEVVLSIFDEVPKLFGGFLDFLGVVFPYLPSEITLLLTFGIVAVVFIGIIKAIRR